MRHGIINIYINCNENFTLNTLSRSIVCTDTNEGLEDKLYTIMEARQLYDMISVKNKAFVEYNTGHSVTKEYAGLVADWFLKTIKP